MRAAARLPGPGRDEERADLVEMSLNPWMEAAIAGAVAPGGVVLDLGCGRGYWMRHLAGRGWRPIGLETYRSRAVTASAQGPVVVADGARIPLQSASVDAVWLVHILHHVEHPPRMLSEVGRVLRPGGGLVMAETVEDNPLIRLGRRVHPHWDGVDVHSRFRARELVGMVEGAGLEITDQRQHSLVSFAAWALPRVGRPAWQLLSRAERPLAGPLGRFGAHFEVVALKP